MMLKRILQIGSLVLLVAGVYFYRELRPQAHLGSGYVAHQICSCVFVAERSYASCLPDLLPSMDRIHSELIELDGRSGVRAGIPLLAKRVAWHTPGLGCVID